MPEKPEPEFVFVCSPFRGCADAVERARRYCREIAMDGNIPIAPHIYFTQFLDDDNPIEREIGILLGREWMKICTRLNFYGQPSEGMQGDIDTARSLGITIVEEEP